VLGPGTGLGVGLLAQTPYGPAVLPGEGGHVGIAPRSVAEVPIFEAFITLWPEVQIGQTYSVEAEGMISGTGLPLLYQACGGQSGIKAAEIFARAIEDEPAASMCLNIFRNHLASLCGNLAMIAMCKGGVFLVGGVAQANPWLFDQTFFDAFIAGGRFSKLRAQCGVYLAKSPDFGLHGCANALEHKLSPNKLCTGRTVSLTDF
jgi:glucokinase